jgi:hypothetical protein
MQKAADVHKALIQELRLASAEEDMSLDKSGFSFDLLDSFRLALEFVKYLIDIFANPS